MAVDQLYRRRRTADCHTYARFRCATYRTLEIAVLYYGDTRMSCTAHVVKVGHRSPQVEMSIHGTALLGAQPGLKSQQCAIPDWATLACKTLTVPGGSGSVALSRYR